MENVLKEMNQEEVIEGSEATLTCMKHILKMLRLIVYRMEMDRIEDWKIKGKITPKEAVHRKALLRKRYH